MAELVDYGLGEGDMAALGRRRVRIIYIIGDSDTGKSTLAATLAANLSQSCQTARVDLDAGQACLGLPTTFAWRMHGGRRGRKPEGMYFTGTTSPSGHFDIVVAGAAAMVSEACEHADKVVVDTCGLALGTAGMRLHHTTIEAVRPDVVLAIEKRRELAGLLDPLVKLGRPLVIRASVPDCVRKRSPAERRSYRREKFRAYFARAREVVVRLDEVGVFRPRQDPVGRIASLRDAAGRDVALAIVRRIDEAAGTIALLTPAPKHLAARAVVLGSIRIARDGRQLGRDIQPSD
jgi:polynucleotide 5'-kinase involved in rRNA processing